MGLLEPTVIPGLDRALLELLLISSVVGAAILILTMSSIVGMIRAIRRRRRGSHSKGAVALALIAVLITTMWLLYWVTDNILHRSNPLDGLLVINLILCVLPFAWLFSAIRANSSAVKLK